MNKMMKRPVRTFGFWDPFFSDFPVAHRVKRVNRPYGMQASPAVNVKEMEDQFVIEMAAPGLEKSDFNINLEDDVLSISVNIERKEEEEKDQTIRKEFSYLKFDRRFNLDNKVKNDGINASYTNGVLVLTLPKRDEVKNIVKTIEIK